jgi:hypothetical protein
MTSASVRPISAPAPIRPERRAIAATEAKRITDAVAELIAGAILLGTLVGAMW